MAEGKRDWIGAVLYENHKSWTTTGTTWDGLRSLLTTTDLVPKESGLKAYLRPGTKITFSSAPDGSWEGLSMEPDDPPYSFGLEGEFQGMWFTIPDIDVVRGDSPVAMVVRAVLGLDDGEELLGVSVKGRDGEVHVRPWHVDVEDGPR
jgi:hypothetical protein